MATTKTTKSKRRKRPAKKRPAANDSAEGLRPAFADAYPRDAALDALVTAFENGNFKRVRGEAEALADRTDDEGVRAAALDLRRRLDPDPIATYLLILGVTLVLFLYGYYALYVH